MSTASDVSMTPPLWAAIADTLRSEIATGQRPPGDRLPTEAALSARFGVNRHTIRRALATLGEEGVVRTRRGAGAFVAARPTDYPMGKRVRFRQSMEAAGRIPGKRLLSLETRPASAAEAEALQIKAGAIIHVSEGLALTDDQPVALFRSRFPADVLPNFPDALRKTGSVTDALRVCGISDYTRISTRLTAEAASPIHAIHLHLTQGAPLLRAVAINAGPDGRPVEYGVTRFAGDRIALTLDHA